MKIGDAFATILFESRWKATRASERLHYSVDGRNYCKVQRRKGCANFIATLARQGYSPNKEDDLFLRRALYKLYTYSEQRNLPYTNDFGLYWVLVSALQRRRCATIECTIVGNSSSALSIVFFFFLLWTLLLKVLGLDFNEFLF